jgi:uncharacterized protein YndB with AHSA1/START domain
MGDITDQTDSLQAVERIMGQRVIPEGQARTAILRRRYQAAVRDVWDAITIPDRLNRFFLPVSGDLRERGHYSLAGNASGEILRCDPPRLLRLQWTPPDERGYSDQVEVRLREVGADATLLELEHASIADVFRNDPDTGTYGVGTGWEGPLHFLAKYLHGDLPDAPAAEWFSFDEAHELELANYRGRAWAAAEAAQTTG